MLKELPANHLSGACAPLFKQVIICLLLTSYTSPSYSTRGIRKKKKKKTYSCVQKVKEKGHVIESGQEEAQRR